MLPRNENETKQQQQQQQNNGKYLPEMFEKKNWTSQFLIELLCSAAQI